MIRINLLAENQRGRRRSGKTRSANSVSPLVILLLLAIFGGVGYAGYEFVARPFYVTRVQLADVQAERESLAAKVEKKKEEIKDLGEIEKMVRQQLEVLQILDPEDRLLWSEKLNIVSDLRPPNVYIDRLQLTENERKVETQESIKARQAWEKAKEKKGKKPDKVMRSIITQTLTIYGISYAPTQNNTAIAEEQAIANFMAFHKALKQHRAEEFNPADNYIHDFLHGMESEIEIGPWQRRVIGDRTVFTFEFKVKTKPLLNEEEAESSLDTAGASDGDEEKSA